MRAILLAVMLFPSVALGAVKLEPVEYKDGEAVLEGFVAYDDAVKEKRPGVLVVHDWMGVGDDAKRRAKELVELGYVAFVADVYGKGVRPKNREEAAAQAGKYRSGDRAVLRSRLHAALATLKKNPRVLDGKVGAMGYCFGGTGVLELARSGADVKGVVSFHGGLDSPKPDDGKNIKGRVLVLHGAVDPFVKAEDLAAFEKELNEAKVDDVLVKYAGAVHSFTQPEAGNDPSRGAAYDEKADKRSFEEMKRFWAEVLK